MTGYLEKYATPLSFILASGGYKKEMWTPIGLIQQLKPYPGGHGEGVTITEWRRKAYQHLSRVTNLGRNYLCKETHEWSAINNARTSIEQYISMSLSYLINQLFF